MAVQVDQQGQLQEFLDILARRKWQVLLPTSILLSIGILVAVVIPKKYVVATQVELREIRIQSTLQGGMDFLISFKDAPNAVHQLKAANRIRTVIEELEWQDFLVLSPPEQAEYIERIQKGIDVVIPRRAKDEGSFFVTIEYRDVDVDRAADFLKKLREVWQKDVFERDQQKLRREYQDLVDRIEELEKEIATEEKAKAELRAAWNLSPTQPDAGARMIRDEDPRFMLLAENETKLDELEIQIADAERQVEALGKRLAETEPQVEKKVAVAGQSYADRIAKLRTDREEKVRAQQGLRPAHSRYKELQSEIAGLDEMIAELERDASEGYLASDWVENPEYAALEEELAKAEANLERLKGRYDRLDEIVARDQEEVRELYAVYREDGERTARIAELREQLSLVNGNFELKKYQVAFIDNPASNPFVVIQEVVPPLKPSEPNPMLIVAFAVVAGLALGLGSSVAMEFSGSAYRSAADISRVMVVPVLGVVNSIVTRGQARRRQLRRAAVGLASAGVVLAIGFVTWAWVYDPSLLSPDLLDAIEELRDRLR